jgi:hypothetical protein|eukprot:COSAG02_NODE_50_length_44860_cov_203.992739_15_plen_190_part_00
MVARRRAAAAARTRARARRNERQAEGEAEGTGPPGWERCGTEKSVEALLACWPGSASAERNGEGALHREPKTQRGLVGDIGGRSERAWMRVVFAGCVGVCLLVSSPLRSDAADCPAGQTGECTDDGCCTDDQQVAWNLTALAGDKHVVGPRAGKQYLFNLLSNVVNVPKVCQVCMCMYAHVCARARFLL